MKANTIIRVKSKEALPLPALFRLALKFIYDKSNFSIAESHQLEDGVINWANHLQLKKDMQSDLTGGMNDLDDESYQLGIIAMLLKQNEEGKLERRKALFEEKGISYKKYYRLRESFQPQDFEAARREYENLCRKRPEENL